MSDQVHAVPVYFVDGIAIMDAPSQTYDGAWLSYMRMCLLGEGASSATQAFAAHHEHAPFGLV